MKSARVYTLVVSLCRKRDRARLQRAVSFLRASVAETGADKFEVEGILLVDFPFLTQRSLRHLSPRGRWYRTSIPSILPFMG